MIYLSNVRLNKSLIKSLLLTAIISLTGVINSHALTTSAVSAVEITGAGATFPYPIYSKWADAYGKKSNIRLNYQSIGSGGGIKQIREKTVDFGASDKPLDPGVLASGNLLQFPAIIGGIVPIVHLKDLDEKDKVINLSGPVLADIFMAKIKKWSDPAIQTLNPDVKLPDKDIIVVHRADGSGTTFLFTNYLTKVSLEWKNKVGSDSSISWPTGLGGKGNEGVAANVKQHDGAIGYVEYAYAKHNGLPVATLQNQAGKTVLPSIESFSAAASNADWKLSSQYYVILTDQPGEKSWPITGASFILMQKKPTSPETSREVLKFFEWAFDKGSDMATQLDYVPLPNDLISLVKDTWKESFPENIQK